LPWVSFARAFPILARASVAYKTNGMPKEEGEEEEEEYDEEE